MRLWSDSFKDGGPIPPHLAFGRPDPKTHIALSDNKNPHLAWSDLPVGTKSLALLCVDSDVPSSASNVNKEGVVVPASLPRVDFFHWIVVDLKPDGNFIWEGEFSDKITPKGKRGPGGPRGTRQGVNNYTQWFAGDADMGGTYFGYDGPCPPWNDEIPHHYRFTLYALDVERCPVSGEFDGPAVLKAIEGHVLGEAAITGTFTNNPEVNAR